MLYFLAVASKCGKCILEKLYASAKILLFVNLFPLFLFAKLTAVPQEAVLVSSDIFNDFKLKFLPN